MQSSCGCLFTTLTQLLYLHSPFEPSREAVPKCGCMAKIEIRANNECIYDIPVQSMDYKLRKNWRNFETPESVKARSEIIKFIFSTNSDT